MSVKKKPSRHGESPSETGRRSVQVKVEVPGSTQSAAERRSAEAELRALIARHASAHVRLIGAVRKSLRKRLPTAHEVVYEYRAWIVISFSPTERGYEGVLSIRADADGVKLYLNRGKELPDPEKLLQGSANARWIDMESASTLARPAVARLIDEAIARNRVPFTLDKPPRTKPAIGGRATGRSSRVAPAGRGSVVIRSTTAKSKTRNSGKRLPAAANKRPRRPPA